MPCSLKQLEANKKNATLSTGPTSPSGKLKSRANALKHGLTGEGIVLPTEDVERVDTQFETLNAEMKPKNELARQVVLRIALLTIRLQRCAEHEAKATAYQMRKAEAEFIDARLAVVENLYSWIASEPATNARRLRQSPEGIDRLLSAMRGLRSDLKHPDGHRWEWQHCEHFHHLIGLRRVDVPVSRARALTEALEGDFRYLTQEDGGDLDKDARQIWAGRALVDLIDSEIANLVTLREGLDHEGLALDRAEAPYRALFDASRDAVLARKYEAATERGLYRALKEFRELQEMPTETESHQELTTDPSGELASFSPETEEAADESSTVDAIGFENPEEPVSGDPINPRKARNRRLAKRLKPSS